MNIEKAFEAIKEWYDGDKFHITAITDTPHERCEKDGKVWDQSEHFELVVGWQSSQQWADDEYYGAVYFQIASNKWIRTEYGTF